MSKSPDAFRTISEVADWLGIQAHVLRFWESKFNQIKPVKRAGGRRYYRPSDMLLLGGIKKLLHDDGMTIKGVQKLLREQGVAKVSEFSQPLEQPAPAIEATARPAAESTVVSFPPKAQPSERTPETTDQLPLELETTTSDTGDASQPERDPVEITEPAASSQPVAHSGSFDRAEETDEIAAHAIGKDDAETRAEPATDPDPAPEPAGPEAVPASAKLRPRIIDVADPPEDSHVVAAPGVLGALAGVSGLTQAQADALTPVARELSAWLDTHRNLAAT